MKCSNFLLNTFHRLLFDLNSTYVTIDIIKFYNFIYIGIICSEGWLTYLAIWVCGWVEVSAYTTIYHSFYLTSHLIILVFFLLYVHCVRVFLGNVFFILNYLVWYIILLVQLSEWIRIESEIKSWVFDMREDIIRKSIISPLFIRMFFCVIKLFFTFRDHHFDCTWNHSIWLSRIIEAENSHFIWIGFIIYFYVS